MEKKKFTFELDEDIIEIELNEKEIKELIEKLKDLINSKNHLHFSFNNKKKHLLIHHEKDELK